LAGAWPETILEPHAWESAAWPPPGLTPRRACACVVGPGLDEAALPRLPDLLAWAPGPVVLDAAALAPAALAAAGDLSRAVLTPHAGEAARLLGGEAELLERDPLAAAARLAERYAAIVVLKGPTSVIAAPDGRQAVSTRGAPALASGGTGDVLAGLLGALLAAPGGGEAAFERVCLGVWAHGVAGELAAAERGYGLVASAVAARLAAAFQQLSGWAPAGASRGCARARPGGSLRRATRDGARHQRQPGARLRRPGPGPRPAPLGARQPRGARRLRL